MTDHFYENIESFNQFSELTSDKLYQKLPEDWYIYITDVKGSTQAIESGRYRDVNILGVSTIISVQNALGRFDFPYVFGGDGASLCVPEKYVERVNCALLGLKKQAYKKFNMELRVARVKASDIYEKGGNVEIAKYEVTKGKSIALFRGGGMALADKLIKEDEQKFCLSGDHSKVTLDGLSCRWEPIKNKRGYIVSMMVVSRKGSYIYKDIIKFLNRTIKGKIDSANPVSLKNMKYKEMMECIKDEVRYHESFFDPAIFRRFIDMLVAYAIFYFKVPLKSFNKQHYMESMITHNDYRKFDDTLRMVIDCSEKELSELKIYLSQMKKEGKVYYGLHMSDEALMTCYVPSTKDGEHIHFIDGGNGGYAMAAKEMKAQMKTHD